MRHAPHLGWYLGLLSLSHGGLAFSQQALQDQEMVVSKSPAQEDLPIDPRHIISPKLSEDQIALARRSAAERPKRTAKLINGFRMQEEGNYVTRDEQDLIARDSLLQRMIETSDEGYSESIRLLEKHASSIQATPDAVFWGESDSGNPLYQVSQSVVAAKSISANLVWPGGGAGYGLTGAGSIVGLWDLGVVNSTHQEFGTPSRVVVKQQGSGGLTHSTEMAGIICSSGVNPLLKGTAPGATVWYFGNAGLSNQYASRSQIVAVIQGVRIGNYSMGDPCGWNSPPNLTCGNYLLWYGLYHGGTDPAEDPWFGKYMQGQYNAAVAYSGYDALTFEVQRYLQVWSAGNARLDGPDQSQGGVMHLIQTNPCTTSMVVRPLNNDPGGYDTLNPTATLKNALVVGAIEDLPSGYTQANAVQLWSNSSTGPTDDGRIKPDLVANGATVTTTTKGSASATKVSAGTSCAAASISGTLALLSQHHRNISPQWAEPYASTFRALLIHTADEAGPAPGPDFKFGWGVANARKAADLMAGNAAVNGKPYIKEMMLPNSGMIDFTVAKASATGPLRVTIAWTDPGPLVFAPSNAVDGFAPALVNDLDLRVVAPSGSNHQPWVLNPDLTLERQAIRELAATFGDNTADNVEQVYIENAPSGNYRIQVTHKGQLAASPNGQMLSMIISGTTASNASAPEITDAEPSPDGLVVSFTAVPGGWYQLQTCQLLTGNPQIWTDVPGEISATTSMVNVALPWSAVDGVYAVRVARRE